MRRLVIAVTVLSFGLLGLVASPAFAASPWWGLNTSMRPASLQPGGEGELILQAINLGDAHTSGAVTVSATLPAGVTVKKGKKGAPQVFFFGPLKSPLGTELGPTGPNAGLELCKVSAPTISCTSDPELEYLAQIAPYEQLEVRVELTAEAGASSGEYSATVGGGEAPSLSHRRSLAVGEAPPAFGAEELALVPEEEGVAIDTRAGSHPFQLTNTFNLNQTADPSRPPVAPRNLDFKLPRGQVGNATALPRCRATDFATELGAANLCPADTALGVAVLTFDEATSLGLRTMPVPIFNLEPKYGEPARFGFVVLNTPVILDTSVRSGPGEDYGVTVSTHNITQISNLISSTAIFWGAPGAASHDESRGWGCLASGHFAKEFGEESAIPCTPSNQEKPPAFLTMPTDCAAPFAITVEGVSWPTGEAPAGIPLPPLTYSLQDASGSPLGLVGCNQLPFAPQIHAEPTADSASSPSGLDFNLNFHDEGLTSAEGLAQSQLKDTVVTLPEGFTINPSAGVGLGGCTAADYARESLGSDPGAGCPNNSKLGSVEISTPLLAQKIHGSIFIAQPHENPFGSLVALYIVAKSPETGILIKLAGKVTPNAVTGQLVTTFENNPQLPFDHFNFHFREGQQAPLITPATCGTYQTTAQLTPWSEPTAVLTDSSSFTITKGFDGGACPSGGVPPFHPAIQAGTLNNNAGVFSPFYLRLTRTDGEQEISGFSTNLPPGLTGSLTGILFCPEAAVALARNNTGAQEEASPSCPSASELGHTLVGTGVGAVLAYVPGKLYLAGPFQGAPFSLVSVTSAKVGPFDLGTVVLRFGLNIDPSTAQVSVSPTASEPIPTIIQGIVTHVRDIRVYVDRPNFTQNPTNCNPLQVSSTLDSKLGQRATISSPFQTANCALLKFTPKFTVSTTAKPSKAAGASLTTKLVEPPGSMGTQANISKVKVELPKQLPSRLTTLQRACTNAQFEANPAGCPSASVIGHAVVHTPLLPVPLEGPAIFVSHGGEAFPSLVIVLQGYGVTVDLVGTTFISKAGITSTTFKTVPDVPFNTFELTLPQGKFSALASNLPAKANGSFCGQKLVMPAEFIAQNGAVLHQRTPVGVSGCPKQKALTRKQKLAKALNACKKEAKGKRAGCVRAARRKYGAVKRKSGKK